MCASVFWGVLQAGLIILKVANVVQISWWAVFIPVYVITGFIILRVILGVISEE